MVSASWKAGRWQLYGVCVTDGKRKSRTPAPEEAEGDAGEFRIGRPEFRIGDPEFRVGDPSEAPPDREFVLRPPRARDGGPRRSGSSEADEEFVIRPPAARGGQSPGGVHGFVIRPPDPRPAPSLPSGWEPVPRQPDWTLPATDLGAGLVRVDRPKPRYRGLKPLKTTIPEDLAEEILDLLVHRARGGAPVGRSMAEFVRTAVDEHLAATRAGDGFAERYPDYSAGGVASKRGRRSGQRATPTAIEASRDVVFRASATLVGEVHDAVIHRNGGTADGPLTVSQFVADAVRAAVDRSRYEDGMSGERYPATGIAARLVHLDTRAIRT